MPAGQGAAAHRGVNARPQDGESADPDPEPARAPASSPAPAAPSPEARSSRPLSVASSGDTARLIPGLGIDWPSFVDGLPAKGAFRLLFIQSELLGWHDDDRIELLVPRDQSHLAEDGLVGRARQLLSDQLGRPVVLQVRVGEVGRHTVRARDEARRAARQAESERSIRNDPFVKTLIEDFGATILPDSIKPIDDQPL